MKREKIAIYVLGWIISALILFLLVSLCGGMSDERWIKI